MIYGVRTRITDVKSSRTVWEGRSQRVRIPQAKEEADSRYPEYRRTRETRWEDGWTTIQA